MSSLTRPVDLTQLPAVPWAWVDEHVYAAIRGCSVKTLQHERRLNIGCPFRRINGTTIRYKLCLRVRRIVQAVTDRGTAAVCCGKARQQLRPFHHWSICPETSMAPGRRLNIGEALGALP